jgi:hypothetical protein
MARSQPWKRSARLRRRYSRGPEKPRRRLFRCLVINLSYFGVPRYLDRHQIEFCMFAVLRICRVLTGQNLVPQHFWIAHYRSGPISEMARFVGTKVEFGAGRDEFALNADVRELPLV